MELIEWNHITSLSTNASKLAGPLRALLRSNAAGYKGVMSPSHPWKVDISLLPNEGLIMKKKKNKYNHYTEDFRREAVRRSDDPNTSAAEVAKEIGIHSGQIYNWRRQYKRLADKQFNSLNGVDYSMEESEAIREL